MLVLTAETDPETDPRLLVAGALAYLTKPVDENLFLALVDETLSSPPAVT